ncbi:MAG TPA: nuclear transport factor 2 family protein [Devosia sp.]
MTARDTLTAYEQRINRHDFDLLLDQIAPDATFWFSDGSHRGIAEIRSAFEKTWEAMGDGEHYWLTDVEWVAEGSEAAACIYQFNWRCGEQNGSGRGTTVLARTSAGWRIVHEHLSRMP